MGWRKWKLKHKLKSCVGDNGRQRRTVKQLGPWWDCWLKHRRLCKQAHKSELKDFEASWENLGIKKMPDEIVHHYITLKLEA